MANITIDIDLPDGVTISGYQRHDLAHGFEVDWPWPELFHCPRCHHEGPARWERTGKVRVLRDLDIHGQPTFWTYGAAFHRCDRCRFRQDLIPPFKRKDASYTLRFEQQVVRLMIGSTEADVARRLGISAETVARIIKVQTTEARTIDPKRVITDLGILQPDPDTCELVLTGIYGGVSVGRVHESTGWDLRVSASLSEVAPPSQAELAALRALRAGTPPPAAGDAAVRSPAPSTVPPAVMAAGEGAHHD